MEVLAIDNFVEHSQNYSDLKDFWMHTFTDLTGITANPYVNNQYANGKEILDGNPIFTSKLDQERGLRIIQTESDLEEPALSAWINKTYIRDQAFEELVIALQLNMETYEETRQLIGQYMEKALTAIILQNTNQKYGS